MTGFADDLVAGLAATPRALAPKWFYDRRGSELFDAICALPEYYPTRVELALLERHAATIARWAGPGAEVVEPGAGAMRKVRLLLDALDRPAGYRPIDISADYLADAVAALRRERPRLVVEPQAADITQGVALPPRAPGAASRLGFYPGSSIGNFAPDEAVTLLRRFGQALAGDVGPADGSVRLLIGVDRVKDPARLHAAYNDAAGVTAAFNLNLWARANREAGADFDLAQWAHAAFYHPALRRIEMHLVSRRAQRVQVAGRAFDFDEGDSVHTENSYKYTVEGFRRLAQRAGWAPQALWTDAAGDFALHGLVWTGG